MELVRTDRVRLDEPVARLLRRMARRGSRGGHASAICSSTRRVCRPRLVDRAAGEPPRVRARHLPDAARVPAADARRIYSDLDFILLGFLAADAAGAPLDARVRRRWLTTAAEPRLPAPLTFDSAALDAPAPSAAPTLPLPGDPRRGRHARRRSARRLRGGARRRRRTRGPVRDARRPSAPSRAPSCAPRAATASSRRLHARARRAVHDEERPSRAARGRSAGTRCCRPRRAARGCPPRPSDTSGFTGTSLWIDPSGDRYFVLLTNRAVRRRLAGGDADGPARVPRRAGTGSDGRRPDSASNPSAPAVRTARARWAGLAGPPRVGAPACSRAPRPGPFGPHGPSGPPGSGARRAARCSGSARTARAAAAWPGRGPGTAAARRRLPAARRRIATRCSAWRRCRCESTDPCSRSSRR